MSIIKNIQKNHHKKIRKEQFNFIKCSYLSAEYSQQKIYYIFIKYIKSNNLKIIYQNDFVFYKKIYNFFCFVKYKNRLYIIRKKNKKKGSK
jgi:hypothetical protein